MQLTAGPALVCRPLEAYAAHLLSTRGWKLGSALASPEDSWHELAQALEAGAPLLARVRQVHGAATLVHRQCDATTAAGDTPRAEADIIVSDADDAALAIQTADCLPLLFADRRTGAVAAAHAGWRGLALSVPAVAVEQLAEQFGSRPADLMVAIGPAIGSCCYEVGDEVRARFRGAGFDSTQLARWFTSEPALSSVNPPMASLASIRRRGHWFFDGAQAAREQLEAAGVPAAQIFATGLCTASHPGVFCSYRRDGSAAGRMAAVLRRRLRP